MLLALLVSLHVCMAADIISADFASGIPAQFKPATTSQSATLLASLDGRQAVASFVASQQQYLDLGDQTFVGFSFAAWVRWGQLTQWGPLFTCRFNGGVSISPLRSN
jgi:hypothetical protein